MAKDARGEDHEVTHDHTLEAGLTCLVFIGDRSYVVQLPSLGAVVIGRGSEADLNVAAEGVSRKHARLEISRDKATLFDLGSRNGTYVNNERLRAPRQVGHGDELRTGGARLVLSRRSASQAAPDAFLLHGAFVSRLRVEVARALGFGRPISLLLVRLPARWFELGQDALPSRLRRPVDAWGLYDDTTLEIAAPEVDEDGAQRLEVTLLEALRAAGMPAASGRATLAGRSGTAEDLHERALRALRAALGEEASAGSDDGAPLVEDPVMRRIYEQLRRIAPSPISVLIIGETGVGKEVLAQSVHRFSGRKGALVCVNTAALPEALLESELFGHERGAFTGATQAKAGLFELADQGTLFLDEIGELPLTMQAKLLRVLEDHTVRRVGGSAPKQVDVRVVAATNADLAQRAAEKSFRQDLYFRLNACALVIPPLRDRPSEIQPLAEVFLARAATAAGRRLTLTPEALALLLAHAWPGNVRELKNMMERAAALCEGTGGAILPEHLPDTLRAPARPPVAVRSPTGPMADVRGTMRDIERQRILDALEHTQGNVTKAAELLGLPRRTLSYRMERLKIRPRG